MASVLGAGWRSRFASTTRLLALRVPARRCQQLRKLLSSQLVKRRGVRPIIQDPTGEKDKRLVLLKEGVSDLSELPAAALAIVEEDGSTAVPYDLHTGYEQVSSTEALTALLPEGVTVPSSFEQVGGLAHLNLSEEQLPWKEVIGQVLLDKNPALRTVVNKLGNIHAQFRTFDMEVLAGEDNTDVEVSESGARFRFDYAQVYWNSRLATEHKRLIDCFSDDDIVCDMMCGIGPFAIPSALRGLRVYANDLNPASHRFLLGNIKLNKVDDLVTPFNLDARDFVRQLVFDGVPFTRVIMNLPASAPEFLDAFTGLYADHRSAPLPTIHCYCFLRPPFTKDLLLPRLEAALQMPLESSLVSLRSVRDVAPQKHMMCVSFRLPEDIAYASPLLATGKRKRDDDAASGGDGEGGVEESKEEEGAHGSSAVESSAAVSSSADASAAKADGAGVDSSAADDSDAPPLKIRRVDE